MHESDPSAIETIVVFALDEPLYAFPLSRVERVIRAVEVSPLPQAPDVVLGVVNLQGQVIPVVDMCTRFGLPAFRMELNSRVIIVRTPKRLLAVAVRSVVDVRALAQAELAGAETVLPSLPYLRGVAKTAEGLTLIYDLDGFLSLEEARCLNEALAEEHGEDRVR